MGKYLDGLIQNLEEMKVESMLKEAESVRFTVTLSLDQMRRLEYFCKYFGIKRATFAADLLSGALTEIEAKFNVTYEDFYNHHVNKTELTDMQKEYFSEVLRIGKVDHHNFKDGKLTITDQDGNEVDFDFSQEEGEDNE